MDNHQTAWLELYHQPYNPSHPVIYFDESSKQLVQETRQPLPSQPGQAQHYDHEYGHNGMRNLFICSEPLGG